MTHHGATPIIRAKNGTNQHSGSNKARAFVAPSLYYPLRVMEELERRGEGDSPRGTSMRRDFDHMCSMLAEASSAGLTIVTGDDFRTTLIPHSDTAKELKSTSATPASPPCRSCAGPPSTAPSSPAWAMNSALSRQASLPTCW